MPIVGKRLITRTLVFYLVIEELSIGKMQYILKVHTAIIPESL